MLKANNEKFKLWKNRIKDLPKETIECVLEGYNSPYPYCATEMKTIVKSVVRTEIEFVQYVYKCPKCGTDDSSDDVIVKAPVPKAVMKRSLASTSSVAEVIYQKYTNGIPPYRQERDWLQRGFSLSRSTLLGQVTTGLSQFTTP